MKIFVKLNYLLLLAGFFFIAACTKDDILTESYDINWPVPVIDTMSANSGMVGDTIWIKGQNFSKLGSVYIGNPAVEGTVISSSDTEIEFLMPRVFKTGPVMVTTQYKKKATSSGVFTPEYLTAKVNSWPSVITRGEPAIIKGENLDMIFEISIDGNKIPLTPGKSSPTQLSIPTQGLTLSDQATIKITGALGEIINDTSTPVAVQNPGDYFEPEQPVVLFDFEDGVDPYTSGDITTTHGINKSDLAAAGRGQKYFTLKVDNVPNAWGTYLGGIDKSNIDVSAFHKPYLTFLVNTNGHEGYCQLAVTQNGIKAGTDFTSAATGVSADDYKFKTNGWEWRSIPLDITFNDWGGGSFTFDKNSLIQNIQFSFKQGNGSNPFEINLDQIMITDGPQKPVYNLYNFEDAVNPYSGTANSGINLSGIPTISGAKYLTVKTTSSSTFNWTGEMVKNGPFDLSTASNAYINFWVNTNGKKGFFQFEIKQNGIKWGGNLNTTDYLVETNGWQLYSLRLADVQWSNWGGTGNAATLDPKGVLDYVKIGFTTGNITGPYEVNIDDISISDGKMF